MSGSRRGRLALALCALLTTLGCDRVTKHLARISLAGLLFLASRSVGRSPAPAEGP